eukprot:3230527-Prymnesium_polylepis.4
MIAAVVRSCTSALLVLAVAGGCSTCGRLTRVARRSPGSPAPERTGGDASSASSRRRASVLFLVRVDRFRAIWEAGYQGRWAALALERGVVRPQHERRARRRTHVLQI